MPHFLIYFSFTSFNQAAGEILLTTRAQGGIASVYWGPLSADRDLSDHDAEVWGPDGNAYLGRNLAVGEVTGDGVSDLIDAWRKRHAKRNAMTARS